MTDLKNAAEIRGVLDGGTLQFFWGNTTGKWIDAGGGPDTWMTLLVYADSRDGKYRIRPGSLPSPCPKVIDSHAGTTEGFVERAMNLAFQWAHAAYCKGLGRPHSDIEPIRSQLREHFAAGVPCTMPEGEDEYARELAAAGGRAEPDEMDREAARIMAASEPELDAIIREQGGDPDDYLRKGRAAVEGALAAIRTHKDALLGEAAAFAEEVKNRRNVQLYAQDLAARAHSLLADLHTFALPKGHRGQDCEGKEDSSEPDMWLADLEFRITALVLAAWNEGEAYGKGVEGEENLQPLHDNIAAARESLRAHVIPPLGDCEGNGTDGGKGQP